MTPKTMLLCLTVAAVAAPAATAADPAWPCIQRKVERLSPALMWPQPIDPTALAPAAAELADLLALRRVDMDAARAAVETFVATHPDTGSQMMGAVFLAVFEKMARIRGKVMTGIANYAESQIALSERIAAARAEMAALLAADDPDFDRLGALEAQIAWDERIYRDRERSLTYVCETPVLIEKRLYAIAQILQQAQGG